MRRIILLALYLLVLTACGGGGDSGGNNNPPANNAPTANAGADQTVDEQTEVTLTGSGTDTDGSVVSYSWVQTGGTSVTLSNAASATTTFTAPQVTANETLTFELTVTDNDGATNTDTVNVIVNDIPPSLSISDAQIVEGDNGTKAMEFVVTLSNGNGIAFTVNYGTQDGTAVAGEDYEATSGTLEFNETGTAEKTITVNVMGDAEFADFDPTEVFNLILEDNAISAQLIATGTILNDDMTRDEALAQLKSLMSETAESRAYGPNNNWPHIFTVFVDIGNDNDKDVLMIMGVDFDTDTTLLSKDTFVYFVNNEGKGFSKVETNIKAFARFHEVVDVNSDGLDDVFVVADHVRHVVDGVEYRENLPTLLIQTPEGGFVEGNLPEVYGDWHGLEALDIEGDGDIDFVASALHNGIYAFVNDGQGNFVINNTILPMQDIANATANDGNISWFFTNVGSADLNVDGFKELFLGFVKLYGETKPQLFTLRNEVNWFTFDATKDIIDLSYSQEQLSSITVPVEIEPIDFNLDGCEDVIAYHTDYFTINTVFTFLQSDCNGNLTKAHEMLDETHPVWHDRVVVKDLNGDGYPDFYTTHAGVYSLENNLVFINNKNGTFNKHSVSEEGVVDESLLDFEDYFFFNFRL